jgi:hypothetical protein
VRRRQSIEEWSSSEGAHRRGGGSGDARTESSMEEGLQWRKTGEENACSHHCIDTVEATVDVLYLLQ